MQSRCRIGSQLQVNGCLTFEMWVILQLIRREEEVCVHVVYSPTDPSMMLGRTGADVAGCAPGLSLSRAPG